MKYHTCSIILQIIEFFHTNVLDFGGSTNGSFIRIVTLNTTEELPNKLRR